MTSTFTLRGRRGAYGTGLASGDALKVLFAAVVAAAVVCVAGMALGDINCVAAVALSDIHLHFAFVLRGRPGTYGTGLALATRLGPVCRRCRRGRLRGRRGTW